MRVKVRNNLFSKSEIERWLYKVGFVAYISNTNTGLTYSLHWKRKHQFNTNVQMQTPDLRYLFPWHSSVHTRVLWTDSQGSCTDKHTAPGRAVTSMTHHKVLRFYATTQCKLGRRLLCKQTYWREAAENIYLILKHSVYACVEFRLLISFLIKRWEMQGC